MRLLEFEFKGDRNYVHGTDMINKYLSVKNNVKSFSVQIRKMTSKNLKIVNEVDNLIVVSEFVVQLNSGETKKEYLVETDIETIGRYEYDEDELVSNAYINIDKQSISMKLENKYSFIENLVALNKKLVSSVVSNKVKWLFVGLDLNEIPKANKTDFVEITLKKSLGTKLVQSKIDINDNVIGKIKFSSIKKG